MATLLHTPLGGTDEDEEQRRRYGLTPPPPEQFTQEGGGAGSAPQGAPGGVTINLGDQGDSTTTTTKTPTTTQKVQTPDVLNAAKRADQADKDTRTAAVKKFEADQELEQKAIEADEARLTQQWENEQNVQRMREAAETRRQNAIKAATEVETAADEKVRQAQDKAINWDDRSVPFKILGALLRAGATRDSFILGRDAKDMPSIRSMDAALATEREKKKQLYLQSKEWRDTLKTKNAAAIKDEYDRNLARIEMEVNSQAKALLMSEKTDTLAMRAAKNDPSGQSYQANKAAMLAELDQKQAKAKQDYAEKWVPTVQSGGTTTTTKQTSGTPGGGKITEAQSNLAGSLSDMSTALKKFRDVKIPNKYLKKIQDNEGDLTAGQIRPGDSPLKPLVVKGMREVGALSRNKFKGVPAEYQVAYQNRERAIDQLNKIITGAASTDAEIARRYQQWILQPDDPDEVIADKTAAFEDFVKNRVALTGPAAPAVAERFNESVGASSPPPQEQQTGRAGKVDGKPAMIFPDGTFELMQ